ncbi:class I SAM-dependent methyltransferase [Filobacillus milosensis]|uniref:Class I SAM-dependent methyltransferase n=1 Tax=Filobacillus milosensis TaxID=94137 RepID=A0A4Y8INR7_9BACI|nr:class I SAM-dependent methyltransferase [Filobacillus milosensis]TFB22160.1 class I SAM-dependent methyltransferase [Filobacillus milosensis]
MNWVKEFYNKQYIWSKENVEGDFKELREDLVDKLETYATPSTKRILELGSGLGQFAVAAAKRGYGVTTIELTEEGVKHAKMLAEKHGVEDQVSIVHGDFYEVEFDKQFDIICYWDGFGIGSDADQQKLLKRVSKWMKSDALALIDIYTPWYWAKVAGESMSMGGLARQYDFDSIECKMVDTWWIKGREEDKVTQYLRCYSPADLKLLIGELNLALDHVEPGGAMNYDEQKYHAKVPLHQAMSYMAVLKKK